MDEIYKKLKRDYDLEYIVLLEKYLQFVRLTDNIGKEILGQDLIEVDETSYEKKKIIRQIVRNLALSSKYILEIHELIRKL